MSARVTNMFDDAAVAGMVLHAWDVSDYPIPEISTAVEPGILTTLLDRRELLDALDSYEKRNEPIRLLVCDLDNFRLINDSFGHSVGDQVLSEIAARLVSGVHEGDTIGRLGGDEFAIVCPHSTGDSLDGLLTALDLIFHDPLVIGTNDCVVTASIGIATFVERGGTIETVAAAETAMHLAKDRGRDRVEVFDEGLRNVAMATLKRTSDLRHAAANGELALCFQPIIELATGQMTGCEALLRWNHPWEGQLSAASFIDIAESSGLVTSLTSSLVRQACEAARDLHTWPTDRPIWVGINLSPRQLADPTLVSIVEAELTDAGVEASRLTVEITETAVLSDLEATLSTLYQLRDLGVQIALDDFGTGYSSLTHLKRLPVNVLKIDRSFVGGVTRDSDDFSIVASVVHLAATLGLTCIAEGIETTEQANILEDLGCGLAQGFLWSPAVPVEDLKKIASLKRASDRPRKRTLPPVDSTTQSYILRHYHDGGSLEVIAGTLNESCAPTNQSFSWTSTSVARVIARSAYPKIGCGEEASGYDLRIPR